MLSRKRKQSQRQQWSKTATKYHPPPRVVLLPRLPRPYHQKTFTLAVNHPQAAPQPTSTPSPPPPSPPLSPYYPLNTTEPNTPSPFPPHPTNPQRQTPQLPTPNSQLLRWVVDGIRANIKGIKIFKKKKNPNPLHSRHFLKALVDL
jgi:hypothetical protein